MNVQQTFLTRASHKGQADSDMADALHKRVITVNEPASDSILSANIIKTISGNDTINARGLFKDPIRYKPFGKLIITCNDVPQFSEFTDALKRRLINIRFEYPYQDRRSGTSASVTERWRCMNQWCQRELRRYIPQKCRRSRLCSDTALLRSPQT